jgi:hypothetical protein
LKTENPRVGGSNPPSGAIFKQKQWFGVLMFSGMPNLAWPLRADRV